MALHGTSLTNTGVTSFNTRTGAVTLTSADVTTALGYTPPSRATYGTGPNSSVLAVDIRDITNPTTGLGYAEGVRFRFSALNDDSVEPYADVIDLSTYHDLTGGGVNALYFGKNSQVMLHKYAAAGGTSWTSKTVAYTDSNITGNAANVTGTVAVANGGTGSTTAAGARSNLGAAASGANTDITALDQDVTITATGTIAANSIGFRGIPFLASAGTAYTFVLGDASQCKPLTTGGWTIPDNTSVAYPVGTILSGYNDSASSQTVAITTDTMYLEGSATTGSRTIAQRSAWRALKVASTTWIISGAGVT